MYPIEWDSDDDLDTLEPEYKRQRGHDPNEEAPTPQIEYVPFDVEVLVHPPLFAAQQVRSPYGDRPYFDRVVLPSPYKTSVDAKINEVARPVVVTLTLSQLTEKIILTWPPELADCKDAFRQTGPETRQAKQEKSYAIVVEPPAPSWALKKLTFLNHIPPTDDTAGKTVVVNPGQDPTIKPTELIIEWHEPPATVTSTTITF